MARRAVFLDRDGTIIRQVDWLKSMQQVRLLPRAAEAIRAFNRMGFLVLVHTNQPVVARGWLTEKELEKMHKALLGRLRSKGARVDAVYYCPHHPNADLKKYRVICSCRKPKIGMIKRAIRQFGVNKKGSFIIGDSTRDTLCGKRAGVRTILVGTGYAGKDGRFVAEPDFRVKNLYAAALLVRRLKS